MDSIGTITSVIAAILAAIALFYTIRNSKGNVIKRIERKQRKIHEIEDQFYRKYGLNANVRMHSPSFSKIDKLQKDIDELKKRI